MLGRLLTAEKSLREHTERHKALQKELGSQHALEKTLRASAAPPAPAVGDLPGTLLASSHRRRCIRT